MSVILKDGNWDNAEAGKDVPDPTHVVARLATDHGLGEVA